VARARYWAPFRTDQENDTTVTIAARESGVNTRGAVFAQADIFLRAANRPSFPGTETCGFIWEPEKIVYEVGEPIAFSATQITGANGNEIARYEWLLSDGTTKVGRDLVHAFSDPGTYTIILVTHEAITGARETCSETLDVE
jgi:PKD repeat protein